MLKILDFDISLGFGSCLLDVQKISSPLRFLVNSHYAAVQFVWVALSYNGAMLPLFSEKRLAKKTKMEGWIRLFLNLSYGPGYYFLKV